MQGVSVHRIFGVSLLLLFSTACTIQSSTSNHYLTAEKLWTEKNYAGAVAEFDRVVKETPNSSIGLQALWRASMTRTLFLNESDEALKGFETFIERAANSDLAPQAQQEIGEIYFTKQKSYAKAIPFYEKLLSTHKFGPDDESKFMYRLARSYFLTNQIKHSITILDDLMAKYPKGPYYDRAEFDLANSWYALGDTDKVAYPKALKLFQELTKRMENKNHALYVESIFGQASTLEEMDQLDDANELFKKIENDYPAPNVIKIRMSSIEDRKKEKEKIVSEAKYRQLGMFGVIVAEVVITPSVLGGVAFYLLRNSSLQMVVTPIAALAGLGVAFYRISLLRKRFEKDES